MINPGSLDDELCHCLGRNSLQKCNFTEESSVRYWMALCDYLRTGNNLKVLQKQAVAGADSERHSIMWKKLFVELASQPTDFIKNFNQCFSFCSGKFLFCPSGFHRSPISCSPTVTISCRWCRIIFTRVSFSCKSNTCLTTKTRTVIFNSWQNMGKWQAANL